jgi:hypothetical protein
MKDKLIADLKAKIDVLEVKNKELTIDCEEAQKLWAETVQENAGLEAQLALCQWVSVEDVKLKSLSRWLARWTNSYGKERTSCAIYIEPKTVLEEDFLDDEFSDGFAEYDEEKDCYWTPGGWYESQYATDVNWHICEKITHIKPISLPATDKDGE